MKKQNKIQKFEDMPVWHDSQDYAVAIYKITKTYPEEEKYALVDQMRRAASSVSANIAEGFGRKSETHKDTSRFYKIALGSLLETKNFIYLSQRLGYISPGSGKELINQTEVVHDQITAILKYFKDNSPS